MLKKIFISSLVFISVIFNSYAMNAEKFYVFTLSDIASKREFFNLIKNRGKDSVYLKYLDNKKGRAATELSIEELCYFESAETYSKNIEIAEEIIKKWAKKVVEYSDFTELAEDFSNVLSRDRFLMVMEDVIMSVEKSEIEIRLGLKKDTAVSMKFIKKELIYYYNSISGRK